VKSEAQIRKSKVSPVARGGFSPCPFALKLELPSGCNVFARRNAGELATLRAENILMRSYLQAKAESTKTALEAVLDVFNGHPMKSHEVIEAVLDRHGDRYSLSTIRNALGSAKSLGQVEHKHPLYWRADHQPSTINHQLSHDSKTFH
jgi:hypothetical protein